MDFELPHETEINSSRKNFRSWDSDDSNQKGMSTFACPLTVTILVYVDDLIVFGELPRIQEVLHKLVLVFLSKETGHLNERRSHS